MWDFLVEHLLNVGWNIEKWFFGSRKETMKQLPDHQYKKPVNLCVF